jgi:diacylglycerol kinase family enzyme
MRIDQKIEISLNFGLDTEMVVISPNQFLYTHGEFMYYVTNKDRIDKIKYDSEMIGNLNELISDRIRTILVVVNPMGGAGSARKTWKFLKPHFERRYKIIDEIFTEKGNHAYEKILSLNGNEPDAVVCLGGDGVLSEIINAFFDARKLHIPVFPIPCGSGNGLVTSALVAAGQSASFTAAVRAALHGRTQPVDLFQVEVGNKKLVAFLSVTMGLMADTDIDSECFRFCGGLRFTVCGLWKIARLKKYNAKVKLIADSGQEHALEGNFTNISVFSVTHASPDFIAAPDRRLNDGLLSAVCILQKDASRLDLVRAMSAAETGSQSTCCPWWKSTPITAFEIHHLDPLSDGFVVDGELIAGKSLSAAVIPGVVALIYAP